MSSEGIKEDMASEDLIYHLHKLQVQYIEEKQNLLANPNMENHSEQLFIVNYKLEFLQEQIDRLNREK